QAGRFEVGRGIGWDLEGVVKILGEPLHTRLLRQSQWRQGVLILEGVDFGLRRLATLFENWQLLMERRQFDLCLERINLTAFPRAKFRDGDLQKLGQEVDLFMVDLNRL